MIKVKHLPAVFLASTAIIFASCGSTPEAEPAPVEDVVKDVVEEVKEEVKEEIPIEDFSEENKSLLEKVEESRNAAIQAGAEDANKSAFDAVEAEYNATKALIENSPAVDYSKALSDIDSRYQALLAYTNAKAKKDKVDELNFAAYNQNAYNEGCRVLDELAAPEANIAAGESLLKQAQAAEANFDLVLTAGWRALAKDERTEAFKAKKDADSVKASVSKKSEYDAAVKNFTSGDSNYVTGNPEGAYSNYKQSKETFTALYEEIKDKRAAAQKLIDDAKERVAQSEKVAVEADAKAPLGDDAVEGIEAEDSKLLEDDDFTEAENSIVAVEESLEGEEESSDEFVKSEKSDIEKAIQDAVKSVESSVEEMETETEQALEIIKAETEEAAEAVESEAEEVIETIEAAGDEK